MVQSAAPGGVRPWIIWLAGTFVFAAAMFSRTSFGVAGIQAAEQFGSPVALMSAFVIVQMVVYASMQLPSGLLLDRLGSRTSLTIGACVMALGQLILALATSFPVGLAARVLIGGGDAMIWISAIRLIPLWFPARRVALLTQLSSVLGQAGQWASAVPLVRILTNFGWTPAFLTVAGACLLGGVLTVLLVRNSPPGTEPPIARGVGGVAGLREVVRLPAAQLAFFMHMSTAYFPLVFTFMWGYPYLRVGQGLSDAQAGWLMTIFVFTGVVVGPITGMLTQRFLDRRVALALSIPTVTVLVWIVVLVWPGQAPMALLVTLIICLASCYPASNIGFDTNRTLLPPHRMGTGSGFLIVGGFLGALVEIGIIAAVLSLVGDGNPGPGAFRAAMASQFVIWVFAVFMTLRTRRRIKQDDPTAEL